MCLDVHLFRDQFPLLSKIAVPVLVISTQSADVERVCKVHKLIHTKIRNRLAIDTVYMLLFCCVNLCILKRLDIAIEDNASHLEGFLAEALDDDHDSAEDDAGDGGLGNED